ncbi:O-acetyl-ADP-ribose deacetylase [Mangrovibacterium marinum]|uniref:O-acetyl-ADP-ribose deacetylase (Regulator of RNase III) n=1 Tax=Mangrovibacterium marinum TaxID=1639118 RepID=A0A2T5C4M0_9BACT|nr:O-acetyl-ADP-ribose deacetylase [Mangrovibacterium marinum]PTN09825.1 O-acetyl-ADP-ribose deacetylase (regulator of RNase III) [Mangrovibacterium marinum]
MERIQLFQGDITQMHVDAIVNAANKSLLGGGGVDGAIHRTAGPRLLEECRKLKGCETGEAKITGAYKLPCRFVIHTVGPVWYGGEIGEAELLANAYRNSLKLARDHQLKTIAFPNISTGVYHFPKDKAAQIAIRTVREFLSNNALPETVTFCVYDDENRTIYQDLLKHEA